MIYYAKTSDDAKLIAASNLVVAAVLRDWTAVQRGGTLTMKTEDFTQSMLRQMLRRVETEMSRQPQAGE